MSTAHTISFDWDLSEFDALVDGCSRDDSIQLGLKWMAKDGLVLEAGCGPGHVVQYLQNLGFAVEGVEINEQIVAAIHERFPALPIRAGDVAAVPVPDNHYGSLLSFGVIEHFRTGPQAPLREHLRVLKPGGIAIISIPSHNGLRRLRNFLRGRSTAPTVPFYVFAPEGEFFEYRMKPAEFEAEVRTAGFTILASRPTHHLIGLWYESNRLVTLRNRRFYPTPLGRFVNGILRLIPFLHNHMHTLVVTKPQPSSP